MKEVMRMNELLKAAPKLLWPLVEELMCSPAELTHYCLFPSGSAVFKPLTPLTRHCALASKCPLSLSLSQTSHWHMV